MTLATGIQLHFSPAIWTVLIVVTVVNYTLLVLALVNVIPRDPAAIRFHNRWIWVALIVLVNFLGPLAYFAVGRIDAPIADNTGADERPAGARAGAAVDLLYGPPRAATSDPISPATAAPRRRRPSAARSSGSPSPPANAGRPRRSSCAA